jgi:phasin
MLATEQDRQYRKRGAAGPRPGGPCGAITLIRWLNRTGPAALSLLQKTATGSGYGSEVRAAEPALRHPNIPANLQEWAMSENNRFEIPKEMRAMAEASFEQARNTFEKFLSSAHQAAGSFEERGANARTNAKEIGSKAVAYAEKNVQASLDYAQSLLKAKDLTEVMKLHSDYVQGQMRSLAEQASEMGQIVSRAAMDAAKPKV